MLRTVSFFLGVTLSAAPVFATNHATDSSSADSHTDHAHSAHDHPTQDSKVKPDETLSSNVAGPRETVVHVHGIVCTFCAHGVQTSLAKLSALDEFRFHKGVRVDIENQRVILALRDGASIPFAEIGRRIRKGGYEPVRFEVALRGPAEAVGPRWRVMHGGQTFLVESTAAPPDPRNVKARAFVAAERAEALAADALVPVIVDAWE